MERYETVCIVKDDLAEYEINKINNRIGRKLNKFTEYPYTIKVEGRRKLSNETESKEYGFITTFYFFATKENIIELEKLYKKIEEVLYFKIKRKDD